VTKELTNPQTSSVILPINSNIGIKPIVKVLLNLVLFFTLLWIVGRQTDRLTSYIITFIATLVSTVVIGWQFQKYLRIKNLISLLLAALLIKNLIGLFHWLLFINPDYFSNSTSQFEFIIDYTLLDSIMDQLSRIRLVHGFFGMDDASYFTNIGHNNIWYFLSSLYYFTGSHQLNFSPFNTLFSIYTALIVTLIALNYTDNIRNVRFVLLLCLFFPFGMIPSIFMRDIVGQFFIAISFYLLFLYKDKGMHLILVILITSFLCQMQRTIYVIFPIISIILYRIGSMHNKKNSIIAIPFLIIVFLFVQSYSGFFDLYDGYTESVDHSFNRLSFFLFLPINVFRAFIGPFPWNQFFKFTQEVVYQPIDYFQSIIDWIIIIGVVPIIIKRFKDNGTIDFTVWFVLLFILTGVTTNDIHTTYFTTAFIFFIPLINQKRIMFKKYFWRVLFYYIILNFIYVSFGLSGRGFSEMLRF
jgi:hypothetical protein